VNSEIHPAIAGCVDVLDRFDAIPQLVGHDLFVGDGEEMIGIGVHLRHCLDHFDCFLSGLERGHIDYDARCRNEAVERDPATFRSFLCTLRRQLTELPASRIAEPIEVIQTASPSPEPMSTQSTVGRELAFLSSHAIHHLAVIAEIIRNQGVIVPETITLAFSTAAYRAASGG
jgi:hypothetical protein